MPTAKPTGNSCWKTPIYEIAVVFGYFGIKTGLEKDPCFLLPPKRPTPFFKLICHANDFVAVSRP